MSREVVLPPPPVLVKVTPGGVPCPVPGSPVQKTPGHTGQSPAKSHKDYEGTWSISCVRTGWKSCDCQPKDKAQSSYKYLKGIEGQWREFFLTGTQWQDKSRWPQSQIQKGSTWTRWSTFLLWGWPYTGINCPERSWSLRPLRYLKAIWTWSLAITTDRPASQKGSGKMTSRGNSQAQPFCNSTTILNSSLKFMLCFQFKFWWPESKWK